MKAIFPTSAARRLAGALGCLALAGALAAPASARTLEPYSYTGQSFDGTGSTAGAFESPQSVAFDAADQAVLVLDRRGFTNPQGTISRFTAAGVPAPFGGLAGASSIAFGALGSGSGDIAVDSSGGASDGNFYVSLSGPNALLGFARDGSTLPGFPLKNLPDACGVAVDPQGGIWLAQAESFVKQVVKFTPGGAYAGTAIDTGAGAGDGPCGVDFDSAGRLFAKEGVKPLRRFDPSGTELPGLTTTASPVVAVDRGNDSHFLLDGPGLITQYDDTGAPLNTVGTTSADLAINPLDHDVYATTGIEVRRYAQGAAITVPTVSTGEPSALAPTGVTLNANVDPDGEDTTDCRFEWGTTTGYGNSVSCEQGQVLAGNSGQNAVSAAIGGLTKGTTYHFRIASENINGVASVGRDVTFKPQGAPLLSGEKAVEVGSDGATIGATLDPNGGFTSYRVKLGTDGVAYPIETSPVTPTGGTAHLEVGQIEQRVAGLEADTVYHYRFVAENDAGATTSGADHTFTTFPLDPDEDPCPNAHERQQTSSSLLAHCRAYELVSAAYAGGYDVESDLVPGQAPLAAFPRAQGRLLYSVHEGAIPGVAGNPTNRDLDPYIAERGLDGWHTRYAGLPSDNPFAAAPFGSPLLGADSGLDVFAFGGADVCNPCFADGSTNLPLRLPDGSIVAGMAGSLDPGPADPEGEIAKPLSADGSHLLFGSVAKFEPDANENGADLTIYDRDLDAGTTQVASTLPGGGAIAAGMDVAALDISADGSRILIGERLATDAAGNDHFHLYMHVGSSPDAIDLMPTASEGALYSGMSEDGSRVYMTSREDLVGDDNDSGFDVFRADVGTLSADLVRVSTGSGAGDTDTCDPVANSFHEHWNSLDGTADCSAFAVGGGGGVSAQAGVLYFLSPEQLDGVSNGTEDAPNLYLARPGESPRYVATLESSLTGPNPLETNHPFAFTFNGVPSPQSVAVDETNGSVYVISGSELLKFDEDGVASNFSSLGTNSIGGLTVSSGNAQVAVDNSGGLNDGNIYVTENAIFGGTIAVYNRAGELKQTLTGSDNPNGSFGGGFFNKFPTSVAVDPEGNVYIGGTTGRIYRYVPSANPLVEGDYDATLTFSEFPGPTSAPTRIAADSNGTVYAHLGGEEGVRKYGADGFLAVPSAGPAPFTTLDPEGRGVAVNPVNDLVVVARGSEALREYSPSGALRSEFGAGALQISKGVAFNDAAGRIYALSDAFFGADSVSVWGTTLKADPRVDSKLVIDAVDDADVRHTGDFQVTPGGADAVFSSRVPLTEKETVGTDQVFSYDAGGDSLDCASCPPSGALPRTDTSLSSFGLNLADDGRVFFTTAEQLVARDTNRLADAYEYDDGVVQLISTGTSQRGSGLVTVSADGADAFFYTREALVPGDENGSAMRIYTAREDGGFPYGPPSFGCAASDECHGPGSVAAVPPPVRTVAGTPGQFPAAKKKACRKGRVKLKGRCVRKKHKGSRSRQGSGRGNGRDRQDG